MRLAANDEAWDLRRVTAEVRETVSHHLADSPERNDLILDTVRLVMAATAAERQTLYSEGWGGGNAP